jgi:DNA-binding GntR family transcriptional regulator
VDERLLVCDALDSRDATAAARLLSTHIDDVRGSATKALRLIDRSREEE